MKEKNLFLLLAALFLAFYFVPVGSQWMDNALLSGFALLHEYSTQHVLTCLVPAFFIAGAIAVFVKKQAVLKYLGGKAKPYVSYPIASVSGAVLAVCSCTILPLFAGIYKRGAGLGPATAFLYSGPAINIAAIFLTASVLGFKIGLARAVSAIALAVLVGLTMAFLFREKSAKQEIAIEEETGQKISKTSIGLFFASMAGILVVNSLQIDSTIKWALMGFLALITIAIVLLKFKTETRNKWLSETWGISKLLIPYLFIGVFIVGFIMPLIPEELIIHWVGSNTMQSNVIASIFGAFMYFSTLTEVPIMQALIAKGMNQGPALALLLAGPSLSLPAMLVIRSVLGNKKTIAYVAIVVVYSSIAGLIFGMI
ncbi:MAG: permease [Candidatus Diapherotrites archaeon]